ncbi:zinc finger BED domain-containing protein RICESLEEPER 2-like [Jatropha curcas]|uniref:zinc finger BED domain-containing protein RICESLEEPER 2-like n=1 Tax=Jatropha curcas TaxID=180498 RepID=UPI0009D75AEA|nr:zinc finger BED domain-containing protein RICESLEEPER 2-like [Jatropha curcas]
MKTATPYHEKISCATVKEDCFSTYEIEKKRIKDLLKDVDKVNVTTYLWKSVQHISYMVVTCHFVDSNWQLQKQILNLIDIPPRHTGVVICDALHKCIVEWEIEDKVWTITVDSAAYNDVAIRLLKDNLLYKNSLALNGKLFHVRCCAHILNLLVQNGLSEIDDIVQNVRESVKHIVKTESRCLIFSKIAKQFKLPSKKLILDCGIRWDATYFMLSAALEYKDIFTRYAKGDPSYIYLSSAEDWRKVKEVCSFLQEFNEVINIISDTEYPTSNLFLPELYNIKKLFNETHVNGNIYMKVMVNKMNDKFDKYWGDYQVKSELDMYLEGVHICEDDETFNALEWWKVNKMKFGILSKVARDILSIPITITISKSTFNAKGEVVDLYRSSLTVNTVQDKEDIQKIILP